MDGEYSITEGTSTKWIEGLALDEINMEESGIVHINEHLSPEALLEEASIEFMDELKDHFEFFTAKFNEYRGRHLSGGQIKIFKISNTVNDFMLFRHSLRLILSRKACDLITVGFVASGKELFAPRLREGDGGKSPEGPHEIKAHLGPFNNISWNFSGERVDIKALCRHYFCEFIVNSATH